MKKLILPLLFVFCLTIVASKCEDDKVSLTQEDEQNELSLLKSEIESLAKTSVCNETAECKYIGLGSKPCGGPWSYLVYSTSIDTKKLKNLVENYNQKEKTFNVKWSLASDCAIANPPSNIKCENNICIAEY